MQAYEYNHSYCTSDMTSLAVAQHTSLSEVVSFHKHNQLDEAVLGWGWVK